VEDDHARCARCGHVSRGFERERFWTVSPGLLLASRVLRVAALLLGPAMLALWMALGGSFGPMGRNTAASEGVLALTLLAVLLGFPAYWTVGKLALRRPELDMVGFWTILLLAAAAALAAWHVPVALLLLSAALAAFATGRLASRWKRRLIEGRPATA